MDCDIINSWNIHNAVCGPFSTVIWKVTTHCFLYTCVFIVSQKRQCSYYGRPLGYHTVRHRNLVWPTVCIMTAYTLMCSFLHACSVFMNNLHILVLI